MCCKKPRSSEGGRKRKETPDIVDGLIKAAKIIDQQLAQGKGNPRNVKMENKILEPADFGRYQARVVVMALAAELALKVAYEQQYPEPAPRIHDLQELFDKLCEETKRKIEVKYGVLLKKYQQHSLEKGCSLEDYWATASQLFKKCKDTFVDWRYIEEEGQPPDPFIMRATLLGYAAKSVVQAVRECPPQE